MKILLLVAAGMAVAEDTSAEKPVNAEDTLSTEKPFIAPVWSGEVEGERTGERASSLTMENGRPRHCKDVMDYGDCSTGLRYIYPDPRRPYYRVKVYCEQTLDGGGWTVIQRRTDRPVLREKFDRQWFDYKLGFGDVEGEFWLGNDNIHLLTSTFLQELRIDLHNWEGKHRYAKYKYFYVGPESAEYRLGVGRYTGDAGESFIYHSGQNFSTYDRDNDVSAENCAITRRGAWWYRNCCYSNLNGYQHEGRFNASFSREEGILWYTFWPGVGYSLKRTTMMIRPAF